MSIIDSRNGDEVLITVNSQSLAGDEAAELKAKTVSLIESGVIRINLDLTKPEYIDSSGIGKLLFMNKKIEKMNGEFSIIKINSTLYDFLESLAITKVMKIAEPS
jgi:anti-sigma B factor antagonist